MQLRRYNSQQKRSRRSQRRASRWETSTVRHKGLDSRACLLTPSIATAHAYTDDSVRHAIDNGVRGIEHGNLISRATAEMYDSSHVF